MKTLVLDPMPELFWQKIEKLGFTPHFITNPHQEISNIEIIILRTKTILTIQDLKKYPKLKMIIRAGSGFDNIDVEEALERNISVCTTPDANAQAAFEHTISLIMAMIKQHQIGKRNILVNNWKSDLVDSWEISDLKALIVGVGRIGTKVGNFLQKFGAEVKGVDPFLTEDDFSNKGIRKIDYNSGLSWCNLITYHCPLYKATRHYFSIESIDMVKNNFWLVNTARGGILQKAAVLAGLKSRQILGLGIDVYDIEPPSPEDYFNMDNVYLTPHIGAFTQKAKKRLVEETITVWKKFVFEQKIINKINSKFI
ncbi:NAD(P)-dependent oxidoreductase [Candidatus Cloacimonadota bacterium]